MNTKRYRIMGEKNSHLDSYLDSYLDHQFRLKSQQLHQKLCYTDANTTSVFVPLLCTLLCHKTSAFGTTFALLLLLTPGLSELRRLESPVSTVSDTVLLCDDSVRSWKSSSTPDTTAPSAERPPFDEVPLVSGLVPPARRPLPVALTPSPLLPPTPSDPPSDDCESSLRPKRIVWVQAK